LLADMFQNHQRCFPFPFFLWRHFVIGILKPAAHKPLLPADKIDPTYRRALGGGWVGPRPRLFL